MLKNYASSLGAGVSIKVLRALSLGEGDVGREGGGGQKRSLGFDLFIELKHLFSLLKLIK